MVVDLLLVDLHVLAGRALPDQLLEHEAAEGLDVTYGKRINEALDRLLVDTASEEPEAFFAITDREKRLAAPPSDGAPIVISDEPTDDPAPGQPVMNRDAGGAR